MEASRLNPKDAYIVIETAFCNEESEPARISRPLCRTALPQELTAARAGAASARTSP
jgi:hypothetical protein